MKRLILLPALFIVCCAHAQTTRQYIKVKVTHFRYIKAEATHFKYIKVEVTHFKADKIGSKLTKYEGGTIDIDSNIVAIDKEAPKPQFYDIARIGDIEKEDEGYTSREYVCIAMTKSGGLKAVKIVAIYTPKKELCDLIVKNGKTNTDYCLTDK